MATKTSINIAEVDSNGKVINRAVTDINPDATNAQITAFANGINGLTNNDYGGTTKITKEEIVSLPSPNLTLDQDTFRHIFNNGKIEGTDNNYILVTATFAGNGKLSARSDTPHIWATNHYVQSEPYSKQIYIGITNLTWGNQNVAHVYVTLSSDGTYAEETKVITIYRDAN